MGTPAGCTSLVHFPSVLMAQIGVALGEHLILLTFVTSPVQWDQIAIFVEARSLIVTTLSNAITKLIETRNFASHMP